MTLEGGAAFQVDSSGWGQSGQHDPSEHHGQPGHCGGPKQLEFGKRDREGGSKGGRVRRARMSGPEFPRVREVKEARGGSHGRNHVPLPSEREKQRRRGGSLLHT